MVLGSDVNNKLVFNFLFWYILRKSIKNIKEMAIESVILLGFLLADSRKVLARA